MLSDPQQGFCLGPWKVEPLRGAISGPDRDVRHLEPKVMEVLVFLAGRPGQLVTRGAIIDGVWTRHVAADQLLTRAISELRRALEDNRGEPTYIETVPKRGYRLICDLRAIETDGPETNPPSPDAPAVRLRRGHALGIAILLVLGLVYLSFIRLLPARLTAGDPVATPWVLDGSGPSVAVLPFVNMSDDPGNEYLADGLAEEIRNLLARIPGLKVIGRTSSFAFRDKGEDLRIIGRSLGVKTVLEGSVRKSGNELRITAQLIDVSDASYIWSRTYRRTLTDIFDLQDDVAAEIIDALKLHIAMYPTRGRPTENPEAYALFLKARVASNIQDVKTAEANLREVVEIDPNFAEAYELLAQVYWTKDNRELTKDAAAKALAIDAGLSLARALYVEANTEEYSFADVINAGADAVRQRPNDPATLRTLSWNLMISGYLREALAVAERFAEIDPISQIAHIRLAAVRRAVGRADSEAALKVAYQLGPSDTLLLDWYIGERHLAAGQDEAAIHYFESAITQVTTIESGWVRDLVTGGRDATSGQAYLDEQIPLVLQRWPSVDAERWRQYIDHFYLLFRHMDRYLEITLEHDPRPSGWTPATYYVWAGTMHRDLGFTAHPKYLEVAERMGYVDVWEHRGPPDFCEQDGKQWACH